MMCRWKLTGERVERLARERSRKYVTADDDAIDARPADVVEHAVERGRVAVDVVKRRDAHVAATDKGGRCTSRIPTGAGPKDRGASSV
jgi:hypothetical protein